MSELNGEGTELNPTERMEADISGVLELNNQIGDLVSQRSVLMDAIKKNITENRIPEELRFLVTSLLHNKRGLKEKVTGDAEKLKMLDEQLREHAGQMIAWLSVDTKVISYRDPGPNQTETAHYFNIGLLPQDAHLQAFINDGPRIKVEKAVQMRFFEHEGNGITWERAANVNLQVLIGPPETRVEPEIHAGPSGVYGFADGKVVALPLPLIGDKAVRELIEGHHLETQPSVYQGLDMLVGTTLF